MYYSLHEQSLFELVEHDGLQHLSIETTFYKLPCYTIKFKIHQVKYFVCGSRT